MRPKFESRSWGLLSRARGSQSTRCERAVPIGTRRLPGSSREVGGTKSARDSQGSSCQRTHRAGMKCSVSWCQASGASDHLEPVTTFRRCRGPDLASAAPRHPRAEPAWTVPLARPGHVALHHNLDPDRRLACGCPTTWSRMANSMWSGARRRRCRRRDL